MWWLVLRLLFSLIPAILAAIKDEKLKNATREEITNTLNKRIEKAKKAVVSDEASDKYNRSNTRK